MSQRHTSCLDNYWVYFPTKKGRFKSKMAAGRTNSVGDPLRIQRMTDHDIDQGDQRTDQVDQDTDPVGQYCGQYV